MSRSGERTLVLCDGSIYSLLACGCAAEETARGAPPARVMPFPASVADDEARRGAVERMSRVFGLETLLPPPGPPDSMPEGEAAVVGLVSAAYAAARNGCSLVVWAENAATGESLDLDRVAMSHDRAVLVSRLVALDAALHGQPGIRLDTPYVDFTDRQIADLVIDMDLPVETCWWWRDPRQAERRRWMEVLKSAGWVAAGVS